MKTTIADCGCKITKTDIPVILGGVKQNKEPVMQVSVVRCPACEKYVRLRSAVVSQAELFADTHYPGKKPVRDWTDCFFARVDYEYRQSLMLGEM